MLTRQEEAKRQALWSLEDHSPEAALEVPWRYPVAAS